jgi:Ca-activated chloride channel family protein
MALRNEAWLQRPVPYQGEAKVEVNTSITGVVFVQCAPQLLSATFFQRLLAWSVGFWLCAGMSALAQQLPYINTGSDSAFSRMDMAQTYLDTMSRDMQSSAQQQARNKVLIDSGLVSALDLAAPHKAVEEFNRANSLLRAQNSKEAMKHLHKAIADYPRFVSAHVSLGLACVDQEETVCAKSEFEAAAKLDDKFAGSFLHLGQLALSLNDFGTAQTVLEKAASLSPTDAKILSRLAYAQHGAHEFRHALETVHRIHALDHKGLANVHYVAASAALALNDFDTMERELGFFIGEDPTNAFAPVARQNLDALARNQAVRSAAAGSPEHATTIAASLPSHTFPNTERLKAELTALGDEFDDENCDECDTLAEANTSTVPGNSSAVSDVPIGRPARVGAWTIRTSVDQVTLFFAVSRHGQMVNNLEASDIQIFDDNKPPEKIVQFAPQSKLPLRLALLVDTSGSVHDQFSFEKRAATKFVEKMLSSSSDLGFTAGFADEVTLTQDFSSEPGDLAKGIKNLTIGGGTTLFDAISFACWKLAGYPDRSQVARVLVILTDGEDNSSHSSLKQSIQIAESTGVTIYTVSTRETIGNKTDADKVLEALAERSGGEAMFPGDIHTLASSFDKLHELIRSRYFIAYKPADFQPNGNYRSISIIAKQEGKTLRVRARKGYHARLETSHN